MSMVQSIPITFPHIHTLATTVALIKMIAVTVQNRQVLQYNADLPISVSLFWIRATLKTETNPQTFQNQSRSNFHACMYWLHNTYSKGNMEQHIPELLSQ
jgi:hypothetical protein